ncbi:protein-L-isoaspartate O-methyltransferase [Mesorhizobium sp. RP14(2022)]|uniref:Protein-L-isoaspartate O-methyltransferase n=1 Tax=Mesorhizobium liriopis TaxID=2953882 RepID=A0ABT1CB52_9HYPH|nr:protein-L-isoaspartate O-methyltransferase [Mesorhizobium liriopis]MCO6052046.1 protein-L-isoaspartate O-methyltransferase [Mesorhizobium liriopis]
MTEPNFPELRVKMVDGQIRTTDVTDIPLLDALLSVPREVFVDDRLRQLAYIDEDLQIAPGRFLMEPSPFAKLAQLAAIRPGDNVLDVGAGTGYASAVFARLGASVTALESDASLAGRAKSALMQAGHGEVSVVGGPLAQGWKASAPYQVIFVNGAVDDVPGALFEQLAEGGRLVVVEGRGNAGVAMLYVKASGATAGRRAFNAAVKPLPGFEKTPAFTF